MDPTGTLKAFFFRRRDDERLYSIMHTLLYPGVLGSLMYALPDNILTKGGTPANAVISMALAFFFAFVMDYTHSITPRAKELYCVATFGADFMIFLLLFVAGQRILGTALLLPLATPFFLALAKFAGVAWELAAKAAAKMPPAKPAAADGSEPGMGTDFAFCLIYLALGALSHDSSCWRSIDPPADCQTGWLWGLTIVLCADALYYLGYRRWASANASAAARRSGSS